MSDDPKEHLRGKLSFVVKSINDQFLVVSNHCLHIKYINFLVKFLTGTCKEYNIHSKVYMLTLIWHCRSPYLNSVDSHQESWWRDMSQQQNNELFTWGDCSYTSFSLCPLILFSSCNKSCHCNLSLIYVPLCEQWFCRCYMTPATWSVMWCNNHHSRALYKVSMGLALVK